MNDQAECAADSSTTSESPRSIRAIFPAVILAAVILGGQLFGLEVVGGDPDRFFRPLKSELVRSLWAGELSLWSDRFGFGMPLGGQSEIGAFYPPHWVVYPILGPGVGYRVSQFGHQLLAVTFMFLLARKIGAPVGGSCLAALIYVLGGFPTIQASKEWAVLGMAWIPAAFLGAEIWLERGGDRKGRRGLALLSISLACLALIGHFQLAQITSLGLAVWILIRTYLRRPLIRRWPGLAAATLIAAAIASPQLALSWKFAKEVGATDRNPAVLSYYSYPPECLTELAFPLWTRRVFGGPEGPFWSLRATTQYEACQFVGTAGLILALSGLFALRDLRERTVPLWALAIAGLGLSTMPQWSPDVYGALLELPGMGLFRCPARYGILAHLALALAAARGWGRWPSPAGLFAILAAYVGSVWFLVPFSKTKFAMPNGMTRGIMADETVLFGLTDAIVVVSALVVFVTMFALILVSATRPKLRGLLLVVAAAELGYFYFDGPTKWGWSLGLPDSSALLRTLEEQSQTGPVVVAGRLDNIPVSAGVSTAAAYFGVTMPLANEMLKNYVERVNSLDDRRRPPDSDEPLRRLGVTHVVRARTPEGAKAFAADSLSLAVQGAGDAARTLYLTELKSQDGSVAPYWAWTAERVDTVRDGFEGFDRLFANPQAASFTSQVDLGPYREFLSELDPKAIVTSDEARRTLNVRHSGSALVVLRRTFDDGWQAIDAETAERLTILPVFGGLQAVLVPRRSGAEGSAESTVLLRYRPASLTRTIPLSLVGLGCVTALCLRKRRHD